MNTPKVLIDGVIFQLQYHKPGGISRVWKNHLKHLAQSDLSESLVLLDRAGTSPKYPGLKKKTIRPYDPYLFDADSLYLEEIMEIEKAALLVSTYYTYSENSPSMIMLYDMTPEIMGLNLNQPEWKAKTQAINKAGAYFSISRSTRRDFLKLHPENQAKKITVVPNAASSVFKKSSPEMIGRFREEYQIEKPYFLLVGNRSGYKNAQIFFKAFSQLKYQSQYEVFCTGGNSQLESVFKPYLEGARCQVQHLSDEGLAAAYSGAICLIYPSLYEGFGLPIVEAQQCGCPVITYDHSSLKEVGGEGALYPTLHDTADLHQALLDVQDSEIREKLIQRGEKNANRFSWAKSSRMLRNTIRETLNELSSIRLNPSDPINTGPRFAYQLAKQPGGQEISQLMEEAARSISADPLSLDFETLIPLEKRIQQLINPNILAELTRTSKTPTCGGLIHYWRGLGYQQQGADYSALESYLDALRGDLNSARVAYLAADLAEQLQEWKPAEQLWETLSRLGHPTAEKKLSQIQQKTNSTERSSRKEHKRLHRIQVLEPPPSQLILPAKSEKDPQVSIILPTKDRVQGAVDFLKSLPAGLQGLPYEVLVYAGGDAEKELQRLAESHFIQTIYRDEEIFREHELFSWAKLMNHGFDQARGDWVVYGSDDIVLYPQAVPLALARASEIAKVGGITFLHRNTVQTFGGYYQHFGYDVFDHKTFINFGLIRKQAYQQTAGFDENYRFYWADVDLCLQLWKSGFRIDASPYSLVDHNNLEDSIRQENSQDRYRQDTEIFFNKWHQDPLFKGSHVLDRDRYVLSEDQAHKVIAYLHRESEAAEAPVASNGHDRPVPPHLRAAQGADREQTARVLASILDAPDVAVAVQDHYQELSPELINLIEANARQAEKDGNNELTEGLLVLSEYIQEQIPPSRSK